VIQNFNHSGTDWAHGNFTYAKTGLSTTFADELLVIQNFNATLAPAGSAGESLGGGGNLGLAASVHGTDAPLPEPGSLSLLAAGAGGLLARRRRKAK
jgi:hypothetical protein